MELTRKIGGSSFPAPTEELEEAIVEYCLNILDIPMGEFWYKWFQTNNPENQHIHLCTLNEVPKGKVKETLHKIEGLKLVKIFKIIEMDISKHLGGEYEMVKEEYEFPFLIHIHIKTLINGPIKSKL